MARALIVKLDHIGDMAMALPAVKALTDRLGTGHTDFVVSSCNAGWKDVLPWAGEFFTIDFPGYSAGREQKPSRWAALVSLIVLTTTLRRRGYDAVVDLRSVSDDWRGKLVARLSGARKRIGLSGPGQLYLTTTVVEEQTHQSGSFLCRLRHVVPDIEPSLRGVVRFGGASRSPVPVVLLHPGAGLPAKLWPESYWIDVAGHLKSITPPVKVRFLGAEADAALVRRLCDGASLTPESGVIGRTIADALRAIAEAWLVVGLDSAAVHLAALVNTPAITVFSAANSPARWRALGHNTVLHHDIECGPCNLRACKWPTHRCMEAIMPDQVIGAVASEMRGMVTSCARFQSWPDEPELHKDRK